MVQKQIQMTVLTDQWTFDSTLPPGGLPCCRPPENHSSPVIINLYIHVSPEDGVHMYVPPILHDHIHNEEHDVSAVLTRYANVGCSCSALSHFLHMLGTHCSQ